MAKKEKSLSLFERLAAKTKGELLGSIQACPYFIDTGNLAFNWAASGRFIKGGIPSGRITELYGPSASAKSLWAYSLLSGCQKLDGVSAILDCENAINPEWLKKSSHLDVTRVLRYTPETLERCFRKIYTLINEVRAEDSEIPILIVYDSITVSPSERELRELELPETYTDAEFKRIVKAHEQPGERAKICSKELRLLNGLLESTNATVLIINQTRSQVGVMFGNPEVRGGGGNALQFYAGLQFRCSPQKHIKDTKLNKVVGVNLKITNKKNRFHDPFVTIENLPLMFEHGVNPLGGLLSALTQSGRIQPKGNGGYVVRPEYSGGKEFTFKSSKERGDVPLSVLMECPLLVDATSPDEVADYMVAYTMPDDQENMVEEDIKGDMED